MNYTEIPIQIIGWRATVLYGDPLVYERYAWLRGRLRGGKLRTLDAGCGNGCFSFYASTLGNTVVGLSSDPVANKRAEERAERLKLKDITFQSVDLRFLDRHVVELGKFDQIICTECIEHIADDQALVRNLSALLAPGGRLLLTTPYKHHRALPYERLSTFEDGGHVRWGYSHEELDKLADNAGLTVIERSSLGGRVVQGLTAAMRGAYERLRWAAILPFRTLTVLDRIELIGGSIPPFGVAGVYEKK